MPTAGRLRTLTPPSCSKLPSCSLISPSPFQMVSNIPSLTSRRTVFSFSACLPSTLPLIPVFYSSTRRTRIAPLGASPDSLSRRTSTILSQPLEVSPEAHPRNRANTQVFDITSTCLSRVSSLSEIPSVCKTARRTRPNRCRRRRRSRPFVPLVTRLIHLQEIVPSPTNRNPRGASCTPKRFFASSRPRGSGTANERRLT